MDVYSDPFSHFARWFEAAREASLRDPTAMTLATATPDGVPSARVVLLKDFDARGFVFYTNFSSRKSQELKDNPRAALCFWWPELRRQVRIEGRVAQGSAQEADLYFASRPRGSQIGAWASPQSAPISSREVLTQAAAEVEARFSGAPVPRPEGWGAWRLDPDHLEFWQDQPDRMHDRLLYTRAGDGWVTSILAP